MRRLVYLNGVGVIALALLCVLQWRRNLNLHLELVRLDQIRIEQASRLVQQEQGLTSLGSDLSQATGLRNQLLVAERETHRLRGELERFTNGLAGWTNAVVLRDARLQEANAKVMDLTERLNGSIAQFNQLASNHNVVVKRLNEFRSVPVGTSVSKP
jgi:hypothetical protein